jgi:hypothetical protein
VFADIVRVVTVLGALDGYQTTAYLQHGDSLAFLPHGSDAVAYCLPALLGGLIGFVVGGLIGLAIAALSCLAVVHLLGGPLPAPPALCWARCSVWPIRPTPNSASADAAGSTSCASSWR